MSSDPRHVVHRLHPALASVLGRTQGTPLGQALTDRVFEAGSAKTMDDGVDRGAALTPIRWFLERTAGDGMPLTAAGYLKPADVHAAAALMPAMQDWPGSTTREINAFPVLDLREHMREIGLLRKYKGTLRASRLGRAGLADVDLLWQHLADGLVEGGAPVVTDLSIVLLVHVATTEGEIDLDAVASALSALGWTLGSGGAPTRWDTYPQWNRQWEVLGNVGERVSGHGSSRVASVAAVALARDALMQERRRDES